MGDITGDRMYCYGVHMSAAAYRRGQGKATGSLDFLDDLVSLEKERAEGRVDASLFAILFSF